MPVGILVAPIIPALTDHEMERIIGAVTVIHQNDEVGQILPRLRAVAIGHLQAKVVVLGVGDHLGMRFDNAAEF